MFPFVFGQKAPVCYNLFVVKRTYPDWKTPGPELLCPAAREQFQAGVGGTDGLCPGPEDHPTKACWHVTLLTAQSVM